MNDDELDRLLRDLPVHDHAHEVSWASPPRKLSLVERHEPLLLSTLALGQLLWLAARLM